MLDFDIVIVTRNRQDYLKLSIPLMLTQTRLPANFIVIDSSDDHEETKRVVEGIFASSSVRCALYIERSDTGITLQRNVGMRFVRSPIVFFPDDDALWFTGVAESIMRVYERDTECFIGAVCALESRKPPPGIFDNIDLTRKMTLKDRVQQSIFSQTRHLEETVFPDPLFVEGYARLRNKTLPQWLASEEAFPVGLMTGFRMTFRTDLIKNIRFDEVLGQHCLFEDRDASLGVLKHRAIVCARRAMVFHYRAPEKRANGFEWGMSHILNRAYLVSKHSQPGSLARLRMKRYGFYKLARYLMQATSSYGWERFVGAWWAFRLSPRLYEVPLDEIPNTYQKLRQLCLSRKNR